MILRYPSDERTQRINRKKTVLDGTFWIHHTNGISPSVIYIVVEMQSSGFPPIKCVSAFKHFEHFKLKISSSQFNLYKSKFLYVWFWSNHSDRMIDKSVIDLLWRCVRKHQNSRIIIILFTHGGFGVYTIATVDNASESNDFEQHENQTHFRSI